MAIAAFKDFNFKLAVVQVLMYELDVLNPPFDVHEFAKTRRINLDKVGRRIIPEVREFFEQLPIPSDALEEVTEFSQDGGNEIYMQLCPYWDGEDDLFNIRSTEDLKLLPNLKKVTLFYDEDDRILEEFGRRGVAAEWV